MTKTRDLYENVIPDEMVSSGQTWYAAYHDFGCLLTNSDFPDKVSRYDYDSFEDLESAMSFVKTYGNHWMPDHVVLDEIEAKPVKNVSKGNEIINEFFKDEKKQKNW